MADRGTFTPLHPTTRKYVARSVREPRPGRILELIERWHEAEPIRNPRERREPQRRAREKKYARTHNSRGTNGSSVFALIFRKGTRVSARAMRSPVTGLSHSFRDNCHRMR